MKGQIRVIDPEAYGKDIDLDVLGMEPVYKYLPFYFREDKVETYFLDEDGMNVTIGGVTYYLEYDEQIELRLLQFLKAV